MSPAAVPKKADVKVDEEEVGNNNQENEIIHFLNISALNFGPMIKIASSTPAAKATNSPVAHVAPVPAQVMTGSEDDFNNNSFPSGMLSNTIPTSAPSTTTLKLVDLPPFLECLPYAPYNKSDKLSKIADWTAAPEGRGGDRMDRDGGGGGGNAPHHTSMRRKREQEALAAAQAALPATLFTYQANMDLGELGDDGGASFSVVDRQGAGLKSRAVRSVKPRPVQKNYAPGGSGAGGDNKPHQGGAGSAGGAKSSSWQGKKTSRWERVVRVREPSIKINAAWKVLDEFDFSRMASLHFEVDEPEDIAMYGSLKYYDKAFEKVNVKSETNLITSTPKVHFNPTASADPVLKKFAAQAVTSDTPTVIVNDSVLAALISCTKSVYSFDIVVERRGNLLILDKRDGGNLDLTYVNENAADPPAETVDKDTNINSQEALAFEATSINKLYTQQILKQDESLVFDKPSPFALALPESTVASGAFRYRKWNLGDCDMIMRSNIDSCMTTKNIIPSKFPNVKSASQPLEETALVNVYALNEFDHRAPGAGGSFEWRKKLDSQRGAVIATEMKNNSVKLARWTIESLLSGVDYMRLGFVSRSAPRERKRHQILGSSLLKPHDFLNQISFNIGNGWGIAKAIIDVCFKLGDGKYILLRDPVLPKLVLYKV